MILSFLYYGDQGFLAAAGYAGVFTALTAWIIRIITLSYEVSFHEGIVWGYKILTDPLNDIRIYWNAPLKFIRGQMYETKESLEKRIKNV
jgi:hypothetical protein